MKSKKNTKDRNLTIRIRGADIEFYEKNLPPEIASISELMRTGAKKLIESSPVSDFDLTGISELLSEDRSRIIEEIQQNRSLIVAIQTALQNEKTVSSNQVKQIAVDQLVSIWLSDSGLLKSFGTVDELEASVECDHLKIVALNALEELSSHKYVTIEPSGKLRWNL